MGRVIVAGCGFVGLATARPFHRAGWNVLGLTHTAESAASLAHEPFKVVAADITERESIEALAGEREAEVVIHCASSSLGGAAAYRAVYLEGSRNLIEVLAPRRFIFTSSTSVYGQTDGQVVTEESAADPAPETGQVLRLSEDFILAHGGIVARLAGIYGPGRSVLLRKFLGGEAVIEGDGSRVINQVHRDDIASALMILAERGKAGIYNVSDDEPMTQREFYTRLANHFDRPLPPVGPVNPNRKRGLTSKRVSNARLRGLGWIPRYGTFFEALQREPELIERAWEGKSAG